MDIGLVLEGLGVPYEAAGFQPFGSASLSTQLTVFLLLIFAPALLNVGAHIARGSARSRRLWARPALARVQEVALVVAIVMAAVAGRSSRVGHPHGRKSPRSTLVTSRTLGPLVILLYIPMGLAVYYACTQNVQRSLWRRLLSLSLGLVAAQRPWRWLSGRCYYSLQCWCSSAWSRSRRSGFWRAAWRDCSRSSPRWPSSPNRQAFRRVTDPRSSQPSTSPWPAGPSGTGGRGVADGRFLGDDLPRRRVRVRGVVLRSPNRRTLQGGSDRAAIHGHPRRSAALRPLGIRDGAGRGGCPQRRPGSCWCGLRPLGLPPRRSRGAHVAPAVPCDAPPTREPCGSAHIS